jgi:hypothetical protein
MYVLVVSQVVISLLTISYEINAVIEEKECSYIGGVYIVFPGITVRKLYKSKICNTTFIQF